MTPNDEDLGAARVLSRLSVTIIQPPIRRPCTLTFGHVPGAGEDPLVLHGTIQFLPDPSDPKRGTFVFEEEAKMEHFHTECRVGYWGDDETSSSE